MKSPLSVAGWRSFREFIGELDDEGLSKAWTDVNLETCARIERDQGILRLFFTSLPDCDVYSARSLIERETKQRVTERTFLQRLTSALG